MVGYVTFVALLNLGLGYALAIYLRGGGKSVLSPRAADEAAMRLTAAPSSTADAARSSERSEAEDGRATGTASETPESQLPTEEASVAAPISVPEAGKSGPPGAGLVTRDYVDQLLGELAAECVSSQSPASVVLMELDAIDEAASVSNDRLLTGVAGMVREMLEEAHTAARFTDQRFLLLLPGDDEAQATQRAEQVRQRIEATEFVANDGCLHATLTCALAQLSSDYSATQLMDQLDDAMLRAKRLGGNRTYTFDGIAPSPVVPPELNLAPQKCAI